MWRIFSAWARREHPLDGAAMSAFFASGHAIDLVLLILAIEAAALWTWHARSQRGLPPLDLLGQLLSGGLLLLALRCALTGADYRLTALLVSAAFPAHLFDLLRRLQRMRSSR
jgi:hypothetical protein